MPNFVSFAASIAELGHGEESHTHSLTHPAYLIPREPKLVLRNKLTSAQKPKPMGHSSPQRTADMSVLMTGSQMQCTIQH